MGAGVEAACLKGPLWTVEQPPKEAHSNEAGVSLLLRKPTGALRQSVASCLTEDTLKSTSPLHRTPAY